MTAYAGGLPALTERLAPRDMAAFRNLHDGETALVCGCGPSLELVRGFTRSLTPGESRGFTRCLTIGVNDVARVVTPDYLVVVNPRAQFTPDRLAHIEDSGARAVFSQLDDLRLRSAPLVRFRLGTYNGTDAPAHGDALHFTQNSPYVAVCLAMHLGARRIGLLGVDFTGPHPLTAHLAQIECEYELLAASARARGVEIVNVSPSSRLRALPSVTLAEFLEPESRPASTRLTTSRPLEIVSYATTPVAGVPAVLARCIADRTGHHGRCVWATNDYGNGVVFDGGIAWKRDPVAVLPVLRDADVVIVHNGKIHEQHRSLLAAKPVITMAHNYAWNVDRALVDQGRPGVVVGQYQATLPDFRDWLVVPNPVPWWEPQFSPEGKPGPVRICFTPSGTHEQYPEGHRLYWHAKGYESTLRVLDRLAARLPIALETTRGRQVSHAESLAMKRRSHIVIDECVTGSYHRNSLEGLAAGCVVINGVGLVPSIVDALLACSIPRAEASPFVLASLDGLEAVLEALIGLGPDALTARGLESRAWLERHWSFAQQWTTFWAPAVARALGAEPWATPRGAPLLPPHVAPPVVQRSVSQAGTSASRRVRAEGVSVVIPHAGPERLKLLATTLALLKQSRDIDQVIIAESGERPLACALAARWEVEHVFVPSNGIFNKSHVLNVGSALARYDLLLWCDNDLLFPAASLRHAIAEAREGRYDVFFPFSRISYLNEADSAAVAQGTRDPAECRDTATLEAIRGAPGGMLLVRAGFFDAAGGMCEEFSGWGGEDCAWLHKARLLGKVGVTSVRGHVAYHQFHPDSGIFGGDPRQRNAAYQHNATLWSEIASLRTRDALLSRLPPPPCAPLPWPRDVGVRFVVPDSAPAATHEAADRWAGELRDRFGLDVEMRSALDSTAHEPARASTRVDSAQPAPDLVTGTATVDVLFAESRPARDRDADADGTGDLRNRRFTVPESMLRHDEVAPLIEALSLALVPDVRQLPPLDTADLPVWMYWEGACPEWIAACQDTIRRHAPTARLIGRTEFEQLRDTDRDIDIDRLHIPHRADFVRAYLLARYGGLWIDSDCVAMRSLQPVLDALTANDFVGHRERDGYVSNAFMAARPGSAIARTFYDTIAARLRSRAPLGWISLGNEPLTRVIEATPARWLELDVEAVQPICWSRPEAYFATGTAADHARALREDAYCYMLSNQNIARHQAANPGKSLTAADTLFSFLLRQAAAVPAEAPQTNGHAAFFADVISRLRPQRMLEINPRSRAWSELAKECAGDRTIESRVATALTDDGEHHDLLVLGDDVIWSPDDVLERADYTLFTGRARGLESLLSPALVEYRVQSAGLRDRRMVGLLSRHDPAALRRSSEQAEIFRQMHANHAAQGFASTSGPGSTLEQTHAVRRRLPLLLQELRVESLLDVACGDFFWQRHTNFGVKQYLGTDVLDAVISTNRAQFGDAHRVFVTLDARVDALPACEALLCRDYLVHLCYQDIIRTLRNFVASGSRWLITTSFPGRAANTDIVNGDWRPLNLLAPPFSLRPPKYVLNEQCTEGGGAFADKSLCVWRLADLGLS